MVNFILKWLTVPVSNETQEVPAVQLWEVRWTSRKGEFHSDVRPEMEAFTSEALAQAFADSLTNAFKLLKHTGYGTRVTMKRGSNG